MIDTGASAMQIVPAISDETASLTIFQRSPTWAAPFGKFKVSLPPAACFLFNEVPLYRAWYRLRLNWLFSDRLLKSMRKDEN